MTLKNNKQRGEKMKTIDTYKGIKLKYNKRDGRIYFNFEGEERSTAYVFEAIRIIDEPRWEDCDLKGYFLDGYIDKFIGEAMATRRNIKTGKPDWLIKGQYNTKYKQLDHLNRDKQIYLKTPENDEIYRQWQTQREKYHQALRKLNDLATSLK